MVKPLRHVWKATKRLLLVSTLLLLALAFWLHGGERSLNFAKPWITSAVNLPNAPYVITIGNITVDWTNAALLGKLHITGVTFAKRDGNVFAQLPELYATIDPIGFLPMRRLLHKVILQQPHLLMTRDQEGTISFGIEGAPARMSFAELADFLDSNDSDSEFKPPSLPFRDFAIEKATLNFTDEKTQTNIISTPFDFSLKRRRGSYDALASMPFTVDDQKVKLSGGFRAMPDKKEHLLALQLQHIPSRLFCLFDTCPDAIAADGLMDGTVAISIAEDLSVRGFHASLSTPKAVITAPTYFAEPLKLKDSSVTIDGDWSRHELNLTAAKLQLEDTTITASGAAHKDDKGWYVKGNGAASQLDITKVYKYWPLTMAPDSRKWITSKLKSGYAASGILKIDFKPEDFAAEYFPEKSIDAIADARDITFEYLPGFPLVEKMNGIAHFTATTVKVEGSGGSLMSGTRINHAVLWCPELNSVNNPMEATVDLTAPAADGATMLALKYFPFDDAFGLNPKTIKGTVNANMKLKFKAFSGKPNSDPNEIHLEAVDYDIATTLKEVAQENLYGSYNARAINGDLKATNAGLSFDGSVALGEAPVNDVKLAQDSGKPLTLVVKGRENKEALPRNDFTLTYQSAAVPRINLSGKRLDASVRYGSGKGEGGILKNFPAMQLDVALDALVMAAAAPFTQVVGSLSCSATRCDSAKFTAKADKADITATIARSGGVRQFLFKASDAGSLLKASGISDRVTRGKLELRGPYDDNKNPPQLNARLLMGDFTMKNSEILGRILSIGSLTGLANALTGSGISFDKLAANVTARAGLITLDKGIASGTAIGITVGGTVDTNASALDLKGVVVPAYALNSLLGKIPLIGALVGGEGEGLIAFNYSVRGTFDKPDVGVNPLSGLTPGFLRGIFGVFDEAPSKDGAAAKPGDKTPVGEKQTSAVKKH